MNEKEKIIIDFYKAIKERKIEEKHLKKMEKLFGDYITDFKHGYRVAHILKWWYLKKETNKEIGDSLFILGFVHDIGKTNLNSNALFKEGPLSKEEFVLVKTHPLLGFHILPKELKKNAIVKDGMLFHHEREDGKGYFKKKDDLSSYTKMLTIVDAFDAMFSGRHYSTRKTYKGAIEELRRCSNKQFSETLVKDFEEMFSESDITFLYSLFCYNRIIIYKKKERLHEKQCIEFFEKRTRKN